MEGVPPIAAIPFLVNSRLDQADTEANLKVAEAVPSV